MKLIIDIDDEQVLFDIKNRGLEAETETDKVIINALYNGIPLDRASERAETQAYFAGEAYGWEEGRKALIDDVKAEIGQGYCMANNDYDKGRNYGLYMATQILDNIGKGSEGGNE